ncbi:MAG TPA: PQQ-binding-like beta-propeller repeat protein, partial [Ferruginibacter sp.]|nr:PQQ-binding-like beta-propeller repeat protein [Ferruginibacter sp.]
SGTVTAYTASGLTKTRPFTMESLTGVSYGIENDRLSAKALYTNGVVSTLIWQRNIGSSNWTFPIISNDSLFYSVGSSTNGEITALNRHTGTVYWSISPGFYVLPGSNMTYYQGNLYACTIAGVKRINSKNGAVVWTYNRPNPTSSLLSTNLAVGNNKVFVGTLENSGVLMALDLTTGTKAWEVDLTSQGQLCPTPLLVNNMVIVSTDDDLVAFDQNTGSQLWKRTKIANLFSSSVYTDNKIIVYNNGNYTALDPATGATLWTKHQGGGAIAPGFSTGSGLCFFADNIQGSHPDVRVVAFRTNDGEKAWEKKNVYASPGAVIYAHNSVYVAYHSFGVGLLGQNALSGNYESGTEWPSPNKFTVVVNDKVYYNHESGNYK